MNVKRHTPEWTAHDLKELARFVRIYGRASVVSLAKDIPLPKLRGRPKANAGALHEDLENVVYCLLNWAEEHLAEGSKTPVEDALRDLYGVTVGDEEKTNPYLVAMGEEEKSTKNHFECWKQTIERKLRGDKKRGSFRRAFEAYLEHARATAPLLNGKKFGAE